MMMALDKTSYKSNPNSYKKIKNVMWLIHCVRIRISGELTGWGPQICGSAWFRAQTTRAGLIPMSPLPSATAPAPASAQGTGQTSWVMGQGSWQLLGLDNSLSANWTKSAAGSADWPWQPPLPMPKKHRGGKGLWVNLRWDPYTRAINLTAHTSSGHVDCPTGHNSPSVAPSSPPPPAPCPWLTAGSGEGEGSSENECAVAGGGGIRLKGGHCVSYFIEQTLRLLVQTSLRWK